MKYFFLILKNLRRNLLRTALTCSATMVMVFVVTLIWTTLYFLDDMTTEKTKDPKVLVREKWQIPSYLPMYYGELLSSGAAVRPGDIRPEECMTWQFYLGTVDPANKTRENMIEFIATEPRKVLTMMDDLDKLSAAENEVMGAVIQEMETNKQSIIVGRKKLENLNKRVGERITVTSFNYSGINLTFDIVGTFPNIRGGLYDQTSVMNRRYLNDAIDAFKSETGKPHPMDGKQLDLVFLKAKNREESEKLGAQIESSPSFTNPAVKVESWGSFVSSFLDLYGSLLWFMKSVLVPSILVSLTLILANSISISVRERRKEMAVLKVLGFRPIQILAMVLGEALLLGIASSLLAAFLTYAIFNGFWGGIQFPDSPPFPVPIHALWWASSVGAVTAVFGSCVPAWSACRVKVSEVFAKIA